MRYCILAIPVLLTTSYAGLCFRIVSSASENGFVRTFGRNCWMTISRPPRMLLQHQRSDSVMLEAIVLSLALLTCALILVAFWGLDLLGKRHRRG
jgi:hypothetical protein